MARSRDLARWTVAAGLLDDPPAVDAAMLAAAVELREAIYRLATAARAGTPYPAADLDRLNRTAAAAPPALGASLAWGPPTSSEGSRAAASSLLYAAAAGAAEVVGIGAFCRFRGRRHRTVRPVILVDVGV